MFIFIFNFYLDHLLSLQRIWMALLLWYFSFKATLEITKYTITLLTERIILSYQCTFFPFLLFLSIFFCKVSLLTFTYFYLIFISFFVFLINRQPNAHNQLQISLLCAFFLDLSFELYKLSNSSSLVYGCSCSVPFSK